MSAELATWEDLEALRQQFPGAPVWGQPGSPSGGGDVNAPISNDTEDTGDGPRRGHRHRKPSSKVTGPQWVQD